MINRELFFKDITFRENRFERSKLLTEKYMGWEAPEIPHLHGYGVITVKTEGKPRSEIIRLEKKIEEIEARLDHFENNTICIDGYREISDEEAEIEIEKFLRELRDEGAPDFTALDIIAGLNLPPDQVDQVIENMRRRKGNGWEERQINYISNHKFGR